MPSPGEPVTRVVALGASNLTLGLQSLVSTARGAFGPEVEVLAALGYGRSYGADSTIAIRRLPGILQSGIWRDLEHLERAPTRGLITDVGNDILYGFPAPRILAWVEEAADRLLAHTKDVVLTDLPVHSIRRLSPTAFLFFRTLFFPPCRLSREQVFDTVAEVNAGLAGIAAGRSLRLVRLNPAWYHHDPIHIRPRTWRTAWREILIGDSGPDVATSFSAFEWARLHTLPPDRRFLMGIERCAPQGTRRLRNGCRLSLY